MKIAGGIYHNSISWGGNGEKDGVGRWFFAVSTSKNKKK